MDLPGLLIRFSLAIWVGGTVVVILAAPVVFRRIASRDQAGTLFGEILRRFEAVKQVLSLALVIGIVVGTFSSIFIASPILIFWQNFRGKGGSSAAVATAPSQPAGRQRKAMRG